MRKSLMMMGILDDADVEWLATAGERQYITAGTVLIREGEPIDALYFLLDGRLRVSVGSIERETLAVLFSGEIVGEISFVDSRPPLASVSAMEDSHLLAVSHYQLGTKIERDPPFAARFYKSVAAFLADRLRSVTYRIGDGGKPHVADEMNDEMMDHVSLAAVRFDNMLKRLRSN